MSLSGPDRAHAAHQQAPEACLSCPTRTHMRLRPGRRLITPRISGIERDGLSRRRMTLQGCGEPAMHGALDGRLRWSATVAEKRVEFGLRRDCVGRFIGAPVVSASVVSLDCQTPNRSHARELIRDRMRRPAQQRPTLGEVAWAHLGVGPEEAEKRGLSPIRRLVARLTALRSARAGRGRTAHIEHQQDDRGKEKRG
jgi:hypothetical protein